VAAYSVLTLDASTPRTGAELGLLGKPVATLGLLAAPTGLLVQVAIGAGGQFFPILVGEHYRVCPPDAGGVRVTHLAATGTVQFLVSFEGLERAA
jgi:hypothetical protein